MRVAISWWVQTDRERLWLRRYHSSEADKCESTGSYCNAMVDFGEVDAERDIHGYSKADRDDHVKPSKDDPRWPKVCDACGKAFDEKDPYQLFSKTIYTCEKTGELATLSDVPVGAVWDAWWISERRKDGPVGVGWHLGPDHRSLMVKLPGNREWNIDARASNCTMPEDNTHHCWVRHGKPEDGTLHVDKSGHTCAAGGGSIAVPGFHGFLHAGELYDC